MCTYSAKYSIILALSNDLLSQYIVTTEYKRETKYLLP